MCVYRETCLHQDYVPVDKGSPDEGFHPAQEGQESGISYLPPCGERWAHLLPAQEMLCTGFMVAS